VEKVHGAKILRDCEIIFSNNIGCWGLGIRD
jgi:hypothetical protein